MAKFGVGYLLSILILFRSCESDVDVFKFVMDDEEAPVITSFDLYITQSDSGKIQYKIFCPRLGLFEGEEPYKDLPKGFNAEIFDDNAKPDSFISANKGKLFNNNTLMDARDNVVVINVEGDTLYTEHLIWDGEKEIIFTDDPVEIRTKDDIIFGDGLEANQSFTKYTIKNPRGESNLDDD